MTDTFESVLPTSNIDMGSVASTTISPKILINNSRGSIINNDDLTTTTTAAAATTTSNDIIEESSTSITETELAEEMAIVIKRKRGRPRKIAKTPKVLTGRKRGRPPKVKEPITTATTTTTATDVIIKRKPGRPKKVVSNQGSNNGGNEQGKQSLSANKEEDKVIKRKRGRPSKIKRSPGRPRKLQSESKGTTVSTTANSKSHSSMKDSGTNKRGRPTNDIQNKQGRGRQRKLKLDNKAQEKKSKNDTTETRTLPKVKRGRGRPPKTTINPDQVPDIVNESQQAQTPSSLVEDHVMDNQNSSIQSNVVPGESIKRKRGRPKKQTTDDIVPAEKKAKRGRGRPKKQLITDDNIDENNVPTDNSITVKSQSNTSEKDDNMVMDESSSDAVTKGLEIGINKDNEFDDIVPLMFAANDTDTMPVTASTSLSMETEIPKIIVTNEKGSDRIYGSSKKKRSKNSDTADSSKKRAKYFNKA